MRTEFAHRMPRLIGDGLLIFFGILTALLAGEIAVRVLDIGKPEFYSYSPTRGWKLRPGVSGWQRDEARAFVRINRWGYRGGDWTVAKPPGMVRIAVLGDSFVEAQQVAEQDTAAARIQSTLISLITNSQSVHDLTIRQVQVMNFGVDGYGTAQEFFTLTKDVWRFSPDVVVLAFFPGNDVRNNSAVLEGDKCRPFFVPHQGGLALGGPFEDSESFRLRCFLRFQSYRSQLLNVMGEARSTARSALQRQDLNLRQRPRSIAQAQTPSREPGVNDLIYRPPVDQNWRDAWYVSEAEIAMVNHDVRTRGALFLAVIVGTGIQVLPNAAAQARYLRTVGGTDLLYPNHRIAALGARVGFEVLDLVPAMKSYAQGNGVYFHGFPASGLGTGHWNRIGNCFAGVIIANRLAAMLSQRSFHLASQESNSMLRRGGVSRGPEHNVRRSRRRLPGLTVRRCCGFR